MLKKIFLGLIVAIIFSWIIWSSMLRVQAYVIGIYSTIKANSSDIDQMIKYYEQFYYRMDTITWESYRHQEKERLKYDIKLLKYLADFVAKLDRNNQL